MQVERAGRLLETLGPGDFFGEAAILTGERRNASVTAASDANLFVLFGTEVSRPRARLSGCGREDHAEDARANCRRAADVVLSARSHSGTPVCHQSVTAITPCARLEPLTE